MSISVRTVAGLIAAALMWNSLFAADPAAKPLVFNTTAPTSDLQGSLSAQVRFAQSQIVPVHPRKGDNQPHLISQRKSLLLVQPLKPDGTLPINVTARDKGGKSLGSLNLDPPEKLPKTAYDVDGIPEEKIDFTAPDVAGSVINNRRDLERLSEPEETFLQGRLKQNALVEIQTSTGSFFASARMPAMGRPSTTAAVPLRSPAARPCSSNRCVASGFWKVIWRTRGSGTPTTLGVVCCQRTGLCPA